MDENRGDSDPRQSAMDNPAMTIPASEGLQTADVVSDLPFDEQADGSPSTTPVNVKSSTTISKYDHGWRRIVRNFSPSWFSITMGTGIVAVLIITLPYNARWLHYISYVFFALNTLLFSAALVVSILRYTLYPEIWAVMIADPNNSVFLGTVPMGFATLIEMWLFACVPAWGSWAVYVAWGAWMVDALVAAAVTVFLIFTHISRSEQTSLSTMTATQLLPIAASIVAAGTGSEVAETLIDLHPDYALGTVITSFVLWGMGTPLAMAVLVMYYQRLAVHKLPPREVLVSSFLPLGPLGFGGYTIMYLGKVSRRLLPITGTLHPLAGDVLYIQGFLVALVLWGFGIVWLVFALATMAKCRPIPFNMGWWGFTFPLGVFSASTVQIGVELPSSFFRILGTVMTCCVVLLWGVVAAGTARGAWSGRLFYAPCLKDLRKEDLDKGKVVGSGKAA